jgi:hypothetical protein
VVSIGWKYNPNVILNLSLFLTSSWNAHLFLLLLLKKIQNIFVVYWKYSKIIPFNSEYIKIYDAGFFIKIEFKRTDRLQSLFNNMSRLGPLNDRKKRIITLGMNKAFNALHFRAAYCKFVLIESFRSVIAFRESLNILKITNVDHCNHNKMIKTLQS